MEKSIVIYSDIFFKPKSVIKSEKVNNLYTLWIKEIYKKSYSN